MIPTNVFAPDSTHAWIIYKYSLLVLAITGAIFVVVGGLLLYAIVRFRQRKGDDRRSRRRSTAASRSRSRGR